MLENILGMLRKRRRVDGNGPNTTTNNSYGRTNNPLPMSISSTTNIPNLYSPSTNDERDVAGDGGGGGKVVGAQHFEIDRFVTVLDQLDARVEKFRKDALGLQEKRDFLLMSVDLIRSHDLIQNMTDSEREEIVCYIQRVNSRLSTVELNVRTVRDPDQEEALSQINVLIDMMITLGDPVISRQRCQQYLNACCSSLETAAQYTVPYDDTSRGGIEMDIGPVDKKFESVLLGCTLDDQKNIKKRLHALMNYLNKQTVRNHPF